MKQFFFILGLVGAAYIASAHADPCNAWNGYPEQCSQDFQCSWEDPSCTSTDGADGGICANYTDPSSCAMQARSFAPITLQAFTALVRTHESYEKIPDSVLNGLQVGSRFYGELKWLRPGQSRYSFDLAVEKAVKYTDSADPFSTVEQALKFDHGRSLLPKNDPIWVALTDYGLITVDGHHHAMASLAVGATTAPMLVTHDLRGRKFKNLREELFELGLTYPIDLNGEIRYPQHFYTLTNDTNRYLVSLLTVRVDVNKDGKVLRIVNKTGHHPVIAKIRPNAVPFQELRVADYLRSAGIVYDPRQYGDHPSKQLRESVRSLLAGAQAKNVPALNDVLIIRDRIHVDKIPFQKLVKRWLKAQPPLGGNFSCELELAAGA